MFTYSERRSEVHLGNFEMRGNPSDLDLETAFQTGGQRRKCQKEAPLEEDKGNQPHESSVKKNYPSFGFSHELTLVTGESSQRLHRSQILSATGAIFFSLLRLSGPCDVTHDVRANRSASFRASLQLRATSELKWFILYNFNFRLLI